MYRTTSILIAALLLCTGSVWSIVVVEDGSFTLGPDWDYDPNNGAITIKTASSSQTYIFWAHEDGQPGTLAQIEVIKRHDDLTSGTVKVKVSKSGGPGATNIGAITFDTANITSIIEGIEITGDLFTDAASTVDHVTGPILVGGSLEKTITVLNDLEGRIHLEGDLISGADIVIGGDMTKSIILADLEGCIHVAGSLTTAAIVC